MESEKLEIEDCIDNIFECLNEMMVAEKWSLVNAYLRSACRLWNMMPSTLLISFLTITAPARTRFCWYPVLYYKAARIFGEKILKGLEP